MAQIKAFNGIRYNERYNKDIAKLTAPPYDVISEQQQKALHDVHPYNVIRLEYGLTEGDNEADNRYTRAAAYLEQWLRDGVLVQDKSPAIYVYQQGFTLDDGRTLTRTGFISLVKLEEFSKGVVLPHEYTLSKPKADRLNLMRACKANFSQIFSLYEDSDAKISYILEGIIQQPADVDFIDSDGISNKLWVIADQNIIEFIQQAMSDKRIFIADGHHRYETALNFRAEMRAITGKSDGEQPFDYVMMMMVAMEDPGLVILPTHRIIKNIKGLDKDTLLNDISSEFDVQALDVCSCEVSNVIAQHEADEMPFFVYYDGRRFYALQLKSWADVDKALPDKPRAYKQLDVSVLHSLIINSLLKIDEYSAAQQTYITYTRDISEAVETVKDGDAQMAFILRPTRIEQVKAVALAAEKMPQKSTYFYPKLLTGLVIYKF
ncbi:DUF1015 domain-containing protein [Mahella sp.]|uniref:DUF1015 domain-containing protein n=1 Tax=Mahella sp. TaxID=2798721 RepID=UPI0025C5B96A|nr:DUF1015 domain-containing protein [Mahella sp.]MBZ4664756.1 hypothetical protein [Mahella sp.]MDK2902556.1 hypothetical protein [Clostridiales bacterium]